LFLGTVQISLSGLATRRRIAVSPETLRVLDWKREERLVLILIRSSPLSPWFAGGVDSLSLIGHQCGPKLIAS